MKSETQVQILNEAIWILLHANAFRKEMHAVSSFPNYG